MVSTIQSDKPEALIVGIGISKRPTNETKLGTFTADKTTGRVSWWSPTDPTDGTMAVALMVDPKALVDVTEDYDNYLVLVRVQPGVPFVYYMGGAWDKDWISMIGPNGTAMSPGRNRTSILRIAEDECSLRKQNQLRQMICTPALLVSPHDDKSRIACRRSGETIRTPHRSRRHAAGLALPRRKGDHRQLRRRPHRRARGLCPARGQGPARIGAGPAPMSPRAHATRRSEVTPEEIGGMADVNGAARDAHGAQTGDHRPRRDPPHRREPRQDAPMAARLSAPAPISTRRSPPTGLLTARSPPPRATTYISALRISSASARCRRGFFPARPGPHRAPRLCAGDLPRPLT